MAGDKLVTLMQAAATGALKGATDMLFGEVASVNPLRITVDNRFEVTREFLVLTSNVVDRAVNVTVNLQPEGDITSGRMEINNALKIGERVILLRVQGGQKFIVIDRAY